MLLISRLVFFLACYIMTRLVVIDLQTTVSSLSSINIVFQLKWSQNSSCNGIAQFQNNLLDAALNFINPFLSRLGIDVQEVVNSSHCPQLETKENIEEDIKREHNINFTVTIDIIWNYNNIQYYINLIVAINII